MKVSDYMRQCGVLAFGLLAISSSTAAIWIKGVDCSSLRKSEDLGGKYFAQSGRQDDALKILADSGVNTIRIRVWIDSPDKYHGLTQLLQIAQRAKANHQQLLVDFHYSYTWADPGNQRKPRTWESYSLDQLVKAVYDHTHEVCRALKEQGTPAAYVQIGNEINDGMLWPEGRITGRPHGDDFVNLGRLLKAGIDAVKTVDASTAIILHLGSGGDLRLCQWWFDGVKAQGVSWDYTGVSYYPYWAGSFDAFQANINNCASRYGKPVLVCETAYPWTLVNADPDVPSSGNVISQQSQLVPGYPPTVQGQYDALKKVISIVEAVPDSRGAGVIFWDGTMTPVTGNGWNNLDPTSGDSWENQTLFDFSGKALRSMDVFK